MAGARRTTRLATAAAAATLLLASPAQAAIPGGNLLADPGAEAATCASATSPPVATIPGWSAANGFTVLCYGASGGQTTATRDAIGGGNGYFFGGTSAASSATQVIDLSASAADFDAGSVTVVLSGYLGGYATDDDNMVVRATFLDGASNPIGADLTIGPVLASDRGNATTLLARSSNELAPPGTRSIRVTMTATRTSGSDNDGSADNLSLTLSEPPPPPNTNTPTVTTGAATVTGDSAILTGTVTPNGGATTYYFDLIHGGPFPSATLFRSAGSASQPVNVSFPLTGLEFGQTYQYRLVALNDAGAEFDGDYRSFDTAPLIRHCVVPKLVGQRSSTLATLLLGAGCEIGPIRFPRHLHCPRPPRRCVFVARSQSPPAGAYVTATTPVTATVDMASSKPKRHHR